MSQVISRHNKKIISATEPTITTTKKDCNCQKAHLPCVMGGKCTPGNVIYRGLVTRADTGRTDTSTGLSEPSWKERWGNHKQNFKKVEPKHRNAAMLRKHILELKDSDVDYTLSFKQIDRAQAYNPVSGICRLCLKEKYHIMFNSDGNAFNRKSEFYTICMHKFKHLLCKNT